MANDFIKNNKFTYEQSVAVKNDYGNVLVSASAGSGKTKVLIGRIINLILEKKCKVKDLLVVTFTNAAADEMRSRLKQELIKYNLLDELDDLNNADIFNLHKFCSKIIKEFFFEVGLDNCFGVLAENEADYLLAECVEKSIIECVNDTEFQNLLEGFNKNRNYVDFKKTIFKIHKFLKSTEDSTLWINNVLSNSFEVNNNNKALSFLNNYYVEEILDACNLLKQLLIYCNEDDFEKIRSAINGCLEIGEKFTNNNFLENFEVLKLEFEFPSIFGKNKSEEEKDLRQKFSEIKGKLKTAIEDYKKAVPYNSLEGLKFALKNNSQKVLKLIDFVNLVDSKYSELKQKFNNLDFNDLEQYALQILSKQNILEIIKNRYKYIFVDEYQDTNSLQEKLLTLISNGDNLFMVGDVKQSIYGFRFCNPQIFIDKYNKFQNSLTDTNLLINLNKNFRSIPDVLNFCNYIFSGVMTKQSCGIDYLEGSMFVSGKNVENFNREGANINIAIFPEEKTESEIANGIYDIKKEKFTSQENDLDRQIYYIANQIKNLLSEEIFDESLNAYRKIRFSDIAILSRNRSKTIERVSNLFKQLNIPVNATFKTKLFESESVNLILNYLRLLDNFYQDIPLYSVLNSFIYNLTEGELALIKLAYKNSKFFYESINDFYNKNLIETDLNTVAINNKLSVFFDDINKLTITKEKLSLNEIVNKILNDLNIINYYLLTENLEESKNIEMFLNFVKESGFESINELLFYLDNFGLDKTFDKTIVDSENSVVLTTIHASKGLEYPIVFVIDMGSKFSLATMHESLIMDLELGLSTSYVDLETREQKDVPTTKGIKLKKKQFEVQEEMRILYVALTRAKEKLFLVGEFNLENIKELSTAWDILSRNSYFSWILGLLSENQANSLIQNGNLTVNFEGSKFKFTIENLVIEESGQNTLDIKADFNTQFIKNYLNFKPQKSEEKLRYTVTEILNEDNDSQNLNYAFTLENSENDIDYSKLGTIYHEIMQKIEFEKLSFMDCKKEIAKLLNFYKNQLKENEVLDEKQIETAVYNLGELVNKSDNVYKEVGFHLFDNAQNLNLSKGENKVAVQGVVDLIIERQNEIIILDYKTSRLKNENDFIKKYKKQLDLYALAVSKFFKKPVSKKIIYSFYLNRLIFL